MASGTIKWFSGSKGFGFIQPDDGSKAVFLHIDVQRAGLQEPRGSDKLEFEVVQDQKSRLSASNLRAA